MKKILIPILLLFFASCTQKEQSQKVNFEELAKHSGYVEDKPEVVAKMPQLVLGQSKTIVTLERRGGGGTQDITPPVVSFASPVDGATLTINATVQLSASDASGLGAATFKVDGIVVKTFIAAPYIFTLNIAGLSNGVHSLSATVADLKGNTTTKTISIGINQVIVIIPPPPPVFVLPSTVELVTDAVGSQLNGECVAFSTVGGEKIEHYYKTGVMKHFSEAYAYNQSLITPGNCNSGTAFTLVLDVLKAKGNCTLSTMPYTGDCNVMPNAAQDAEAANFKITGYSKILTTDTALIKLMLTQHHPLMAGVSMDNSFTNAQEGFIWQTHVAGAAPHAMLVVGYDDNRQAFKLMNSWGTEWGDAGFGWISYSMWISGSVIGYWVYKFN
jgi:hypothetical protein